MKNKYSYLEKRLSDIHYRTGTMDYEQLIKSLEQVYSLKGVDLSADQQYVKFFNDFLGRINKTPIDQLTGYIRTLTPDDFSLDKMADIHKLLAIQINADLQDRSGNDRLYRAMSKVSVMYEFMKVHYEGLGYIAASDDPASTTIKTLYANMFPLERYVDGLVEERKERPFLESFLKTHPEERVRKISNIKVRKVDNSNEFTVDQSLLDNIQNFINMASNSTT